MPKCKIRKDLVEQGVCVPVGDTFIEHVDENATFEYRWKYEDEDDECFEIFVDNKWQEAQSIDFEFIN